MVKRSTSDSTRLIVVELGQTEYKQCWDIQKDVFDLRVANEIPDALLLTEHEHVYTIGTSGNENHLLASPEELESNRIEVFKNDRGGDITYHGPGQLVGYPIIDLNNHYFDLHRYLRDLEEAIIRTLGEFGVNGCRKESYTGVWVGGEKICAIGVKSSKWVTMHGFALNVNTDLSRFGRIIPCGIFEYGVTSLREIIGEIIDLNEVSRHLVHHFSEVFYRDPRVVSFEDIVSPKSRNGFDNPITIGTVSAT